MACPADAQAQPVVGAAVVIDKRRHGIVVADQRARDVREHDVESLVLLGHGVADGRHRELRRGGTNRDAEGLDQDGREVGVLACGELAGGIGVRLRLEADDAGGGVRQRHGENHVGGAGIPFHHLGIEHRQRRRVFVGDDGHHALPVADRRADDVTQVHGEELIAFDHGLAPDLELQRAYCLARGNHQPVLRCTGVVADADGRAVAGEHAEFHRSRSRPVQARFQGDGLETRVAFDDAGIGQAQKGCVFVPGRVEGSDDRTRLAETTRVVGLVHFATGNTHARADARVRQIAEPGLGPVKVGHDGAETLLGLQRPAVAA